jgi:hypothetical protein
MFIRYNREDKNIKSIRNVCFSTQRHEKQTHIYVTDCFTSINAVSLKIFYWFALFLGLLLLISCSV